MSNPVTLDYRLALVQGPAEPKSLHITYNSKIKKNSRPKLSDHQALRGIQVSLKMSADCRGSMSMMSFINIGTYLLVVYFWYGSDLIILDYIV